MTQPSFPVLVTLVTTLALSACTRANPPTRERREALGESEAAPTAEATRRIDPRDLPSPPEPANAAEAARPEQARLEELLRAMSEASEEAASAGGESSCARAYASNRRFAESLRARMGGEPLPPDTEERRAAFVRACDVLPGPVQRCLVMGYSVAHQEECSTVRREMSDETREAVRTLMADLGPLANAVAEAPR